MNKLKYYTAFQLFNMHISRFAKILFIISFTFAQFHYLENIHYRIPGAC